MEPPGQLKILVQGAQDLDTLVTVGEQQPYYILEVGSQRSKSKPCRDNGRSPIWNTAHKFDLQEEMMAKVIIKDDVTKGIIGEALIDLSRARSTGKDESATPLTTMGGQLRGLLNFKLKFSPADGYSLSGATTPDAASASRHEQAGGPLSSNQDLSRALAGLGTSSSRALHRQETSFSRAGQYEPTVAPSFSMMQQQQPAAEHEAEGPFGGQKGLTSLEADSLLPPQWRSIRGGGDQFPDSASSVSGYQPDEAERHLESVDSKVSLAKAAMAQLTAELAELTGAPVDVKPGPRSPSAAAGSVGHRAGDVASSPGVPSASWTDLLPPQGGHGQDRPHSQQSVTSTTPTKQQQLRHMQQRPPSSKHAYLKSSPKEDTAAGGGAGGTVPHSAQRSPQAGPAAHMMMPPPVPPASPFDSSGYQSGTGTPTAASVGSRSEPLLVEDLIAMYSKTAAELRDYQLAHGEQTTELRSHKQLVAELREALEAAHNEKVAAEEELSSMKQSMAMMSSQHFLEVKRLRDHAVKEQAAAVAAAIGAADGPHQPGATAIPASRRRSLSSYDAGSPSGNGVPAHRLEIQLHQKEGQLAEQSARLQAQAERISALQAELESARAFAQQSETSARAAMETAESNLKAAEAKAAALATAAAAARAEAAAAVSGSESTASTVEQVTKELNDMKAVMAGVLSEKAELEEALGLMERNSQAEIQQLQTALARAEAQITSLQQGSSDVATLQVQLSEAQSRLESVNNNNEEVEYLQQQLRRTLRQVVELQHQVQVLQSSHAIADVKPDAVVVANGGPADHVVSENEFLMQELVATKLELAELKEKQLVLQRQVFKATGSHSQSRPSSGGYST